MARDLFLRAKERAEASRLRSLHQFAIRNDLKTTTYEDILVSAPDFPSRVLQRHSNRLGYIGLSLLMGGFLALAAYHLLEILAH